jgi:hypothetical protein
MQRGRRGSVRCLVFAAFVALLVSAGLTPYAQAESERAGRGARHKLSRHHERASRVICPAWQHRRSHAGHRRRQAAVPPRMLLGGTVAKLSASAKSGRSLSRARLRPFVASYAVQFKAGLSGAERDAAMATLRDKYKLKIIKINKALDILRVAPRSADRGKPARSLGAALTPKIIQDLRKEPFVDAAYVDFPVSPQARPVPGQ